MQTPVVQRTQPIPIKGIVYVILFGIGKYSSLVSIPEHWWNNEIKPI